MIFDGATQIEIGVTLDEIRDLTPNIFASDLDSQTAPARDDFGRHCNAVVLETPKSLLYLIRRTGESFNHLSR
jgi:hypothetical protein